MAADILEWKRRMGEGAVRSACGSPYVRCGIVENEILQLFETSIDTLSASLLHDGFSILNGETSKCIWVLFRGHKRLPFDIRCD